MLRFWLKFGTFDTKTLSFNYYYLGWIMRSIQMTFFQQWLNDQLILIINNYLCNKTFSNIVPLSFPFLTTILFLRALSSLTVELINILYITVYQTLENLQLLLLSSIVKYSKYYSLYPKSRARFLCSERSYYVWIQPTTWV